MPSSKQRKALWQAFEEIQIEAMHNSSERVKNAERLLKLALEIPVRPSPCGRAGKRCKYVGEIRRWAQKRTRDRLGTIKRVSKPNRRGQSCGYAYVQWDGTDSLEATSIDNLEILP